MIRYVADRVETLADRLCHELSAPVADPFAEDLILTRTGGLQRWLSQRLSRSLGSSGRSDGVCARVTFSTPTAFLESLCPTPGRWSSQGLSEIIMPLLSTLPNEKVFAHLHAHLSNPTARPRRRAAVAQQIAERFAAQIRWERPTLMEWASGTEQTGANPFSDEHLWQPALWRAVISEIGSTPWDDDHSVADLIVTQANRYARIVVFCPETLTASEESHLSTMDSARPLLVLDLPDSASRAQTPTARGASGPSGRTPETNDLAPVDPARKDGSPVARGDLIEIHAAPADRQVDTLAEVLVSLLRENPDLEPRDILVHVHQPERYAGLLEACFWPDESDDASPQHRIRASSALRDAHRDQTLELLELVFAIVNGRGSANELFRLCTYPAVMAHFGLTDADLALASTMIMSAGIRWGVDAGHRRSQGMEGFPHNTWVSGMNRMALGIGISEADAVFRGSVLPLDIADSDSVRLVGALDEIVAVIRVCCQMWPQPGVRGEWARRLTVALEGLTGSGWMDGRVGAAIHEFDSSSQTCLTVTEAQSLLRELVERHAHRPGFLNGDLAITAFGTMSLVPYKVILHLGVEASTFPRISRVDGEDVTGIWKHPNQDSYHRDCLTFRESLLSARRRFIVIYCGFDPQTGTPHPVPSPVAELLATNAHPIPDDAARSNGCVEYVHPPQSFFPDLVGSPAPPARSEARPQRGTPRGRFSTMRPPTHAGHPIGPESLADLLSNPAAHWLRHHVGLTGSVLKDPESMPVEMPVSLTALDRWKITDRMLRLLRAGKPAEQILQAELRRGTLPPGETGVALAAELAAQAQNIHQRAQPFLVQPLSLRWIDQSVAGVTGVVATRGESVVSVMASRVRPHHQLAAWIKILILQVAHPEVHWQAALIGLRSTIVLNAPEPDQAHTHLRHLRRAYDRGLVSPLPLPASAGARMAWYLARGLPPDIATVTRRLKEEWERDPSWALLWHNPEHLLNDHSEPEKESDDQECQPLFTALAAQVWAPMMKAGGVA